VALNTSSGTSGAARLAAMQFEAQPHVKPKSKKGTWGRYPTAYRMHGVCVLKKAWSALGLVDKTSPAFELRNSGVPAAGSRRQVTGHPRSQIPAASCQPLSASTSTANCQLPMESIKSASISSQEPSRSPLATGMPLCCSSWVLGGIDNRRCAEALQTADSPLLGSLQPVLT
jgi:hypothetical protein